MGINSVTYRSAGFQPAVSQGFQPADPHLFSVPSHAAPADWKSAIRQVGNLRYATVLPPWCTWVLNDIIRTPIDIMKMTPIAPILLSMLICGFAGATEVLFLGEKKQNNLVSQLLEAASFSKPVNPLSFTVGGVGGFFFSEN